MGVTKVLWPIDFSSTAVCDRFNPKIRGGSGGNGQPWPERQLPVWQCNRKSY